MLLLKLLLLVLVIFFILFVLLISYVSVHVGRKGKGLLEIDFSFLLTLVGSSLLLLSSLSTHALLLLDLVFFVFALALVLAGIKVGAARAAI